MGGALALGAEKLLAFLTDDKTRQNEIKHQLRFLFQVLDSLHVGIIAIDRRGRIIYVNHAYARIIGVSADRVLGRDLAEIEPGATLLRCLREGRPILDGYVALQSVERHLLCDHTPIRDEKGGVIGAVATFRGMAEMQGDPVQALTDIPSEFTTPFLPLVGRSVPFLEVLAVAQKAARSDASILIQGESGTGKELLARAVHAESSRAAAPLVAINCAAIPETLLESELFGYEGGAFTGARQTGKAGKIETADGGTLFLDEIGELPLPMQAKVLRVLQERKVERIGALRPKPVDVRIISATNQNLERMVQEGAFRTDLYFRLNVIPLTLPPLRERPDDIPRLVTHFVRELTSPGQPVPALADDYMKCVMSYDWPGNIRELRNVVEYSLVMSGGSRLERAHLPPSVARCGKPAALSATPWGKMRQKVQLLEKEAILNVLRQTRGNRSQAIRLLGVSRATFYKRLKELGIDTG